MAANLPDPEHDLDDFRREFTQIKLTTLGVFIGILVVAWAPLVLWKCLVSVDIKRVLDGDEFRQFQGRYRMRSLLNEWGVVDVLAKNKGLFVPLWSVDLPSSFARAVVSCLFRLNKLDSNATSDGSNLDSTQIEPNHVPS
jgi:hypothetical protein